jgi:hypothetical protein
MFIYNGLNTLSGVFILHLLRKARGCCMHVFSSTRVCENIAKFKVVLHLFMSWTVFDVMRMREYRLWLNTLFFILKGRILLFYSICFVLNFIKKFTKVRNVLFFYFNWK